MNLCTLQAPQNDAWIFVFCSSTMEEQKTSFPRTDIVKGTTHEKKTLFCLHTRMLVLMVSAAKAPVRAQEVNQEPTY